MEKQKPNSPLKAIKEFCSECIPEGRVKDCTASSDPNSDYYCPLFEYRLGHNPYRKNKEYTEEEKAKMAEQMKTVRAMRINKNS